MREAAAHSPALSGHVATLPIARAAVKRGYAPAVTLAEAAAQAEELWASGKAQEIAQLRAQWDEELESQARSQDFRERAMAMRAIGMFRWRAKEELLRRGLDDTSPAARGSALLSIELLSRDHPSSVNSVRPILHKMLNDPDENAAVRRLAILALKNGSAQRETIVLLDGTAADDDEGADLRRAAASVAQELKRKAIAKR